MNSASRGSVLSPVKRASNAPASAGQRAVRLRMLQGTPCCSAPGVRTVGPQPLRLLGWLKWHLASTTCPAEWALGAEDTPWRSSWKACMESKALPRL